jgi:hypothetical protein
MPWRLEIDDERSEFGGAADLEDLLTSPKVRSAVSVVLKRVLVKPPVRWEKVVYPLLGLVVPQDEPRGTIQIFLSGDYAQMVFLKDDADIGFVALPSGKIAAGEVEFSTVTGEKFCEPADQCIPRSDAFAAILEFFKSGKRPSGLKWTRVGAKHEKG